jgi:hypothetical protein
MAVTVVGRVYRQETNVLATMEAAQPLTTNFFSSWFWQADTWKFHPVSPKYMDFSVRYSLSEELANVVDGEGQLGGDTVLMVDVNQTDAQVFADLQTGLAAYLTDFFGRIFTISDIRGCRL